MCPIISCIPNPFCNFCRFGYPTNGSNFRHGCLHPGLDVSFSCDGRDLFVLEAHREIVIVTLVFFICGVEIVMGLSIFELQCDATGLKPSVGLIGHVKDIVKELTEDPENDDPGFVNPAIEARLESRRENEKDSLASFSLASCQGSNPKRSFKTVNNNVLQSTNRIDSTTKGKHKSNAEESSTAFENNGNVTQLFRR